MQDPMTIKQFKLFIKTQMKRIEDISCNIASDIYRNYNQTNSIKLVLPKFYDSYEKQYTYNIYMSSWEYLLSAQSVGCWKLFKAHNIQLNYHFIRFVVENEYPGTKIFHWLLANSDYINQFLSVRVYSHIFPESSDYYGDTFYDYNEYIPVKFEEFIYQCLQYQDFHKVDIIAKTNYDINENRLLERIVIELDNDSDWNMAYLLNLFATKPNFNFDCINSFLKIKLLYWTCGQRTIDALIKYYPNILANKEISAYIKGKYPESEYQLTKAKLKKYLFVEYNYNTDNIEFLKKSNEYQDVILVDDPDDDIIYDPLSKHVFTSFKIGLDNIDNDCIKYIFEDFSFYLKCIKLIK